jgi:hypothetical protein
LTGVTTELGSCQVRIEVDHPCTHPAVVETRGVPFRERWPASRRRWEELLEASVTLRSGDNREREGRDPARLGPGFAQEATVSENRPPQSRLFGQRSAIPCTAPRRSLGEGDS